MKTKLKNQKGFTIIEVLIVLAIAGLILLIVFLAVPALQRNQRNTARKGDAGRVGGAATEFVSNNNGTLPATGAATIAVGPPVSGTNDAGKIIVSAGKLSQYDFIDTGGTPGNFSVVAAATAATGSVDKMQLAIKAKCTTPVDGTTIAGTQRQMAIQYTVESAGAVVNLCTDI